MCIGALQVDVSGCATKVSSYYRLVYPAQHKTHDTRLCVFLVSIRILALKQTETHTRTQTQAHTQAHAHTNTHMHTQTNIHASTHTHAWTGYKAYLLYQHIHDSGLPAMQMSNHRYVAQELCVRTCVCVYVCTCPVTSQCWVDLVRMTRIQKLRFRVSFCVCVCACVCMCVCVWD